MGRVFLYIYICVCIIIIIIFLFVLYSMEINILNNKSKEKWILNYKAKLCCKKNNFKNKRKAYLIYQQTEVDKKLILNKILKHEIY